MGWGVAYLELDLEASVATVTGLVFVRTAWRSGRGLGCSILRDVGRHDDPSGTIERVFKGCVAALVKVER